MAKQKMARYVVNNKLPKAWLRLLEIGDFFRLGHVTKEDGKPPGLSAEDHERFQEISLVDRIELGIAAFSLACIIITFIWLR